jgi:mono/diheme cytochrome c family protein
MARHRRRGSGPGVFGALLLLVLAGVAIFAGELLYQYWRDLRYPAQEEISGVAARMADPAFIERGRYLAAAGDCVACHTVEGGRPFAGGLGLPTPFGTIYAPNITPDQQTGIGGWSDRQFVRALHKGLGRRGQLLYPAFPYTSYTRLSIEDALAIKAYLFSLDPVSQRTPPNSLRFPFDQRYLLAFWNLLFFEEGRFQPAPDRDPGWNRGAYLVEALGHCGDCHTPRNLLQGPSEDKFAGARIEGWWAYNITPARNAGIGGWSDAELEQYLATGVGPGHGRASGPMAEVVQNSPSLLTPGDRKAIVTYLRSVPPIERGASQPRDTWGGPAADVVALRGRVTGGEVEADGARLFIRNCASCHGWSGGGVAESPSGGYPPLFHNGNVGGNSTENVLNVILQGVSRRFPEGEVFMPGFAAVLEDREIASLANYVLRQFGDPANATVKPEDVAALRHAPPVPGPPR